MRKSRIGAADRSVSLTAAAEGLTERSGCSAREREFHLRRPIHAAALDIDRRHRWEEPALAWPGAELDDGAGFSI